ncbi:hypothetical protein [Janibacter limosus]|uniref:hypothetical protein n=1 Tax=Janibacter limosus TaxID=53458 RepID=UPI000831E554|nr:hypothetical protein [Janibacter limosus]
MIPDDTATELGRAVRRWQQLPLDRAADALPGVHALCAELAGEPLPDLGPAVAMDQLRVVVFDACRGAGSPPHLAQRLAELRLTWS